MRPYQTIAFQFSHHVLNEDGLVEHRNQFLMSDSGIFPNFQFIRELKKSLNNDSGTIFCWATHEHTVLNQIREQLLHYEQAPSDKDELIEFIESIVNYTNRPIVDLNKIAMKCYFHPKTQGKTSIKKTLPAVLNTSIFLEQEYSKPIGTSLSSLNFPSDFVWFQRTESGAIDPYELLKEFSIKVLEQSSLNINDKNLVISDGGAATMAYARLQFENIETEEKNYVRDALLRYCELDTLAMVLIVRAWMNWCK